MARETVVRLYLETGNRPLDEGEGVQVRQHHALRPSRGSRRVEKVGKVVSGRARARPRLRSRLEVLKVEQAHATSVSSASAAVEYDHRLDRRPGGKELGPSRGLFRPGEQMAYSTILGHV